MAYKILSSIIFLLSFFPKISVAQKQLSDKEIQFFYILIKQTKEYKIVKEQVDSVNKDINQIPQEVDIGMLKEDTKADVDDVIFDAKLQRTLAIGIPLDIYIFQYNKNKRQIVSIKHDKRFEITK